MTNFNSSRKFQTLVYTEFISTIQLKNGRSIYIENILFVNILKRRIYSIYDTKVSEPRPIILQYFQNPVM